MVRSINDVNMIKSVLNSDYGLYIFIQPSVLDGEVQNHNSLIDGICVVQNYHRIVLQESDLWFWGCITYRGGVKEKNLKPQDSHK